MTNDINTFSKLEAVFGTNTTPLPEVIPEKVIDTLPAVATESSKEFPAMAELDEDYQLARKTLRNMLEKGEHSLDNMLQLAVQTESARAFEVAGKLIETMSSLSQNLIDLHEKTHKAKKKDGKTEEKSVQQIVQNNTTQNVVFQGSTSDLFNMV